MGDGAMANRDGGDFDEATVAALDAPERAKLDAVRLSSEIAARAAVGLAELLFESFPPDGVKLTLTCRNRRLTAYFFGDGRFVFGKRRLDPDASLGEGELSLGAAAEAERSELLDWLFEAD